MITRKSEKRRKKKGLHLGEKESLDVSWSSASEPELVNRRHIEAEVSCLQVRAVAARRPRGQTVKAAEEANQQHTHCNCFCSVFSLYLGLQRLFKNRGVLPVRCQTFFWSCCPNSPKLWVCFLQLIAGNNSLFKKAQLLFVLGFVDTDIHKKFLSDLHFTPENVTA